MTKHAGFTLLELMFTVFIASILLGLAVPSFLSTIRENKIVTATNDFLTGLNVTRSEAIRRSAEVTLCKSANASAAAPDCTTNSGGYDQGWIIFVDEDDDQVRDTAEVVVRAFPAIPDGMTLTGNTNIDDYLIYKADGSPVQNGTFTVCLPDAHQRTIAISITGRPETNKASSPSTSCP